MTHPEHEQRADLQPEVGSLPHRPWWRSPRTLLAAGVAAGTAYVYLVDPSQSGRYLPCPFLTLTGAYCPGCGGLRSLHALLHGDLAESLARHPFVAPGLLLAAVLLVLWWVRGRPRLRVNSSGWGMRLALAFLAAFWVLRNLPGWDWLSPV